MQKDFNAITRRIHALRLTEGEFLDLANISRTSWWRSKKAKVGGDTRVLMLRRAEGELDRLEGEKARGLNQGERR